MPLLKRLSQIGKKKDRKSVDKSNLPTVNESSSKPATSSPTVPTQLQETTSPTAPSEAQTSPQAALSSQNSLPNEEAKPRTEPQIATREASAVEKTEPSIPTNKEQVEDSRDGPEPSVQANESEVTEGEDETQIADTEVNDTRSETKRDAQEQNSKINDVEIPITDLATNGLRQDPAHEKSEPPKVSASTFDQSVSHTTFMNQDQSSFSPALISEPPPEPKDESSASRHDVESTFTTYAQLIHASRRPIPSQADGSFPSEKESTGLLADIMSIGLKEVNTVRKIMEQKASGAAQNDREYLMEEVMQVSFSDWRLVKLTKEVGCCSS